MRTTIRLIAMVLGAALSLTCLATQAAAGCGDPRNFWGPFEFAQPYGETENSLQQSAIALDHAGGRNSIVGLWKVQFVSKGNSTHNPPIPDGAVVDFGYTQWHSDGTEILNSGGRAPASENFCLGVWGRTGAVTYTLNHFALSYDPATGALNGNVNIREDVILSASGNKYTGTFTIDVFDPKGNHVDHIAGQITGIRLTVDSTLP